MLIQDRDESITMGRLQEMSHFVDDDVFQEILGLFDELGVQADVSGPVIAASPLGLHPLQEVAGDLDLQPRLPFLDENRHDLVKQGFVPGVDDFGTLLSIAPRTDGEGDAFVIQLHSRLGLAVNNLQQVAPAPEIMTLPLYELPGCFPCLIFQLGLLLPDPSEAGDGIGSGDVQTGHGGCGESDSTIRRMHGEMHVLDGLPGYLNGKPADPDRLAHQ